MDDLRRTCATSTVFLRHEAIEAGYDDRALARSVRAGVLHRVRRGAYVFGDVWAGLDERARHLTLAAAVLRTARTPSVLSHVSAVVAHGAPLWELPLGEVDLTRLDLRAGRRAAGVRQHRGLLTPAEVVEVDGLPVTSPARAAIDLTLVTDVEHALVVVDDLLHRGLVTKRELFEVAQQRDQVPASLATDLTVRLADGRVESVAEARSLYMFWLHGLPAPVPQHEVRDERDALVARLDFAWPELGVFVEFDGREKYLKHLRPGQSVVDAVLAEKSRESLVCRLTGWRCVRIVWADLYRPAETCALIRSAMTPYAV